MIVAFFLDHQDLMVNITNIMLWRVTYMALPKEQKGHIRRGVHVVMSVRVTVSRSERFLVRFYRAERRIVREVEKAVETAVERELDEV